VFRFGRNRAGERFAGRQEVRTLSVPEARAESRLRRKLGLPSAFSGHKVVVKTALFPGNYRTHHRPNDFRQSFARREITRTAGGNRLGHTEVQTFFDARGKERTIIRPGAFTNNEAESDLSARGRHDLRKGRGIAGNAKGLETLGGALRNTVDAWPTEVELSGSRLEGRVGAGGDDVDYAKYVEFGTRRSRAQPFLRPALALARTRFRDDLVKAIRGVR